MHARAYTHTVLTAATVRDSRFWSSPQTQTFRIDTDVLLV